LTALLEEVQFLVETRRSTAQARGLFLAGLTMGEAAGPYVGLKLQGLTQVARQSNDLLTTVDECALRYEAVVRVDPLARLAMCVGQLALAVDAGNRARESADIPSNTPAVLPQVQPAANKKQHEPTTETATETTINNMRQEFGDL
jgi:hypothetical protein